MNERRVNPYEARAFAGTKLSAYLSDFGRQICMSLGLRSHVLIQSEEPVGISAVTAGGATKSAQ